MCITSDEFFLNLNRNFDVLLRPIYISKVSTFLHHYQVAAHSMLSLNSGKFRRREEWCKRREKENQIYSCHVNHISNSVSIALRNLSHLPDSFFNFYARPYSLFRTTSSQLRHWPNDYVFCGFCLGNARKVWI